jgi:hypothetical protein
MTPVCIKPAPCVCPICLPAASFTAQDVESARRARDIEHERAEDYRDALVEAERRIGELKRECRGLLAGGRQVLREAGALHPVIRELEEANATLRASEAELCGRVNGLREALDGAKLAIAERDVRIAAAEGSAAERVRASAELRRVNPVLVALRSCMCLEWDRARLPERSLMAKLYDAAIAYFDAECRKCSGTGRILADGDCGHCGGTGARGGRATDTESGAR